jgi:small GTP-binding protein
MGNLIALLQSFFNPTRKLDVLIVGLENAGKTTLVNTLMNPNSSYMDTTPTIKFDMKIFTRDNVVLKILDMGGQERFREDWPEYAAVSEAIIYVVDSADRDRIKRAGEELHNLLEWKQCEKKPLLVLLNKTDIPNHMTATEAHQALKLNKIDSNPLVCMPVTATNLASTITVLDWLKQHSK